MLVAKTPVSLSLFTTELADLLREGDLTIKQNCFQQLNAKR